MNSSACLDCAGKFEGLVFGWRATRGFVGFFGRCSFDSPSFVVIVGLTLLGFPAWSPRGVSPLKNGDLFSEWVLLLQAISAQRPLLPTLEFFPLAIVFPFFQNVEADEVCCNWVHYISSLNITSDVDICTKN